MLGSKVVSVVTDHYKYELGRKINAVRPLCALLFLSFVAFVTFFPLHFFFFIFFPQPEIIISMKTTVRNSVHCYSNLVKCFSEYFP